MSTFADIVSTVKEHLSKMVTAAEQEGINVASVNNLKNLFEQEVHSITNNLADQLIQKVEEKVIGRKGAKQS